MNKKLWYINAALLIAIAAIWIFGLLDSPKYPSEAAFVKPESALDSGNVDISDLESETILAARSFSNWLDPPPAFGSVKINIEPKEAIDLGAAWRVGGREWLKSGDIHEKVSPGKKLVTFKSISEWNSPKVTVDVVKDKITEITAEYTLPPQGTVKITIQPQEILNLHPKWKVGDGDWLENGQESQKTAIGKKNIAFSDVQGWDQPTLSINVEQDKLTEATAVYELIRYGLISVSIAPEDSASLTAAQWSIDKKTWYNFNSEPLKTRLGSYTISFKAVPDWNQPDDLKITMDEEKTYDIVAEYTPIPYASVAVNISPLNDERISSAQWRVDNGPWLNLDQMAEKVTLSEHKISFKDVNGWKKPEDVTFKADEQIRYELDGQYERIKPPGPKFKIITVVELGGGEGMVFISEKEIFKVGESIEEFKLVKVAKGTAYFTKEGFDYELSVEKKDSPVAPAKTQVKTPIPGGKNEPERATPPRPGTPGSRTPTRPGSFRRPSTSRS